jgi:hypothetical protein
MRTHIQVVLATAVALLALGASVHAADVPYVSGGVGTDERLEMTAREKDHNLKIVVADDSGDFLADVQIAIDSAKKETVLEATMAGPILLAKLPPGTYTVKATSEAKTLTKTVTVPAQGLRTVDFRWPKSPEDKEKD